MFDLVFLRYSHAHASHSERMCGYDMSVNDHTRVDSEN